MIIHNKIVWGGRENGWWVDSLREKKIDRHAGLIWGPNHGMLWQKHKLWVINYRAANTGNRIILKKKKDQDFTSETLVDVRWDLNAKTLIVWTVILTAIYRNVWIYKQPAGCPSLLYTILKIKIKCLQTTLSEWKGHKAEDRLDGVPTHCRA